MQEQLPGDSFSGSVDFLRHEVHRLRQENAQLTADSAQHQAELLRLEAALQEVNQLKNALDQQAVVIVTDTEGVMTYVNEQFCRLSQYTREELLGQKASLVSSNYHSPSFWQELWQTIITGGTWRGEIRNQAKDGGYFWVNMAVTSLPDEQGKPCGYVAIRSDITHYKRAQSQLRFHDHILSHVTEAVIGLDNQHRITYWNRGAEKQYGWQEHEIMGKPLTEAFQSQWIHPEDEVEAMRLLDETGTCRTEVIHRLRNGARVYVEATTQVLGDERGEKQGLLAVIRDVTKRLEAEKSLRNTLVELRNRNNELDQYVYKMSHDLRAPLTSILGLIQLIHLEQALEIRQEYLNLIENRAVKLDGFIQSVLNQSQVLNTQVQINRIDFAELIRAGFEDLRLYPHWERIQLGIRLTGKNSFYSDESRLVIIVKNLVSNAIKYANHYAEESHLDFEVAITPEEARIQVCDNGIGIDAAYQSRIFDLFFKATDKSDGAGLGLYIVKQAVEKLQGHLTVESQKGTGTTFYLVLPNWGPEDLPE